MLECHRYAGDAEPVGSITLTWEQRTRSRLKACADDGREVVIYTERGGVLRDGDRVAAGSGEVFAVRAAAEAVSVVTSADSLLLSRLCFHLGNRHVAVQIGPGRIAWQADHVLDEMVRGLGAEPTTGQAPFEPEQGAYGGQGHGHGHGHGH